MIRTLAFVTVLGAAAIAGAQAPPQQNPPQQPPAQSSTAQKPAAQPETTITVDGCLKPGALAGRFILADASAAPAASTGQSQPGAVATTGAMKSYNLMTKPGEDLTKHLNHKMEVTGTVSARVSSAPASGTTAQSGATTPSGAAPQSGASQGATAGAAAKPGAMAQPAETLNVQSFRMVAATCS